MPPPPPPPPPYTQFPQLHLRIPASESRIPDAPSMNVSHSRWPLARFRVLSGAQRSAESVALCDSDSGFAKRRRDSVPRETPVRDSGFHSDSDSATPTPVFTPVENRKLATPVFTWRLPVRDSVKTQSCAYAQACACACGGWRVAGGWGLHCSQGFTLRGEAARGFTFTL